MRSLSVHSNQERWSLLLGGLLFAGYVVTAPFSSWLALTGWLRLPLQFILGTIVLGLPFWITKFWQAPKVFIESEEDILTLAMLPLLWVSFLMGSGSGRSFNHLLSFVFVFGVYLIFVKYWYRLSHLSIEPLLGLCAASVWLSSIVGITEWTALNVFNIEIRPWFILDEKVSNMDYYDQFFFKSIAGGAEEPSLYAFNLNCLFPLGLLWYQLHPKRAEAALFFPAYVVALLATASAGGIGFAIIGGLMALAFTPHIKYIIRAISGVALVLFLGWVFFDFLSPSIQFKAQSLVDKLFSKVTFNNDSAAMRVHAWQAAIIDWQSSPFFGKGPGYGNEAYSGFGYQSAYLKILAEGGLLSLLLFVGFLGVVFYKAIKMPLDSRPYFVAAFMAGALHLFIADAYYHISFWIVVAAIQLSHTLARGRLKGRLGV